ncbi:helix-turn-helix transcriptional regulator [Winogradskya humida]|uniref:HTH luxR-type domain-containing protein n=1 Tax=Winogradskya humida TaxID=113566 RepID=A0ABQ3ZYC3_9ACTN|nr:helix-turn-helix transcriptional regulator [Actinoplanes humidus]GIE23484.1 hypothetical protein Ahu01nite_065860 [Actinoplanes humidus]
MEMSVGTVLEWLRVQPPQVVEAVVASAREMGPQARRPVPRLSDRELTALVWWLRSMTKASVARRMGVSPHTVDMYIKRIRAKYAETGCLLPTKADLLARAVEDGLIELGGTGVLPGGPGTRVNG